MFADRVVEAVVRSDRVRIEWNRPDDATGSRHPPGLKYMFTELICNAAGGPEVVTSKGFDEAKLGIDPAQWPAFLSLVEEQAGMWPTKHHRELVLRICEASKAEICFGMEGEGSSCAAAAVEGSDALGATGDDASASPCPFSGNAGGQCPFAAPPRSTVSAGLGSIRTIDATADAAAATPPVDSTSSSAGSEGPRRMAGRVLGSALQQRLDELAEEDANLCCPVTLMVFKEPVQASDGFIYEKASLTTLLANSQPSPMTRELLTTQYQPAILKRQEVDAFRKARTEALIQFAEEAAAQEPNIAATALERAGEYIQHLSQDQAEEMARLSIPLFWRLKKPVPRHLMRIAEPSS